MTNEATTTINTISANDAHSNDEITKKFLQLVRYSVDASATVPLIGDDWSEMFRLSVEHAVAGVVFGGVERMPEGQRPPRDIIFKWYAVARQLEQQNAFTDKETARVETIFRKQGFGCCILKGQGNALYYPQPSRRCSGDIDIWVTGDRGNVIALIRRMHPGVRLTYLHGDVRMSKIDVEVHFRPSLRNSLIANCRLQRYFIEQAERQCNNRRELPDGAGSIAVPTDDFNRIYQLCHIAMHFLSCGIGLRQLIDYYYLLRRGFSRDEQQHDEQLLRRFGLMHIASGVCYILREVFGLDDEHLIVKPDERRGRQMLSEVMQAGNFGYFDRRVDQSNTSRWYGYRRQALRNILLLRNFTGDTIWEPVMRTYTFIWKKVYAPLIANHADKRRRKARGKLH